MSSIGGRFGLFLAAVLLFGQGGLLRAADDFRVVASSKLIHSILLSLMQGAESPVLLLSDRETPYQYDLSEAQRKQIESADLLVWTGKELEPFMLEPVGALGPETKVVELLASPALKILPRRENSDQRDPFFWLDTRNVLIMIDELAHTLMDRDPARAHLYRNNRRSLFKQVAEIDRRLEYGYRGMQQGVALLYYDSLQYFHQAYALRLGGVLSPLPPQPIAAQKLLTTRVGLVNGEFDCVLIDVSLPTGELALLIDGVDVAVGELDSLGVNIPAGPDFYIKLMEYNTQTIQRCLGDKAEASSPLLSGGFDASRETMSGRFILTDHHGRLVTEEDMLGHYTLLYFGYTYCPDICPTSLQVASLALKRLGGKADLIQPWFVTIDPERDKQDAVRQYVQYFDQRYIGLTGTPAMIERVARQYKVRYEKVLEPGQDPDLYVMDHTASLFLIGPDGEFITKFAYGITADDLVARLLEYL